MKFDKTHIGKKFRIDFWMPFQYFIPLGFTSGGQVVGESEKGFVCHFSHDDGPWVPFEEHPKDIKKLEYIEGMRISDKTMSEKINQLIDAVNFLRGSK